MLLRLIIVAAVFAPAVFGLEICPYEKAKQVIRVAAATTSNAQQQMITIRAVMEELTKAYWGVVVVEDSDLVSEQVHWTVPNVWTIGGDQAFCVTVYEGKQYNLFMLYDKERTNSRSRRHALALDSADEGINPNTSGISDAAKK